MLRGEHRGIVGGQMEHAPLRPVPARPAGPIDPATAIREVCAWLPMLHPDATEAFALVVLSERPRAEAAASIGVSENELSGLLAAARKELRRTLATLGGSGWCERAEGLISDRLDGALAGADVRRLDVHLRNCARCVEHERRLVQATDALVVALGGRAGGAPPEVVLPADDAPEVPDRPAPVGDPPLVEAPPEELPPVEAPPEDAPPEEAPTVEAPPEELPPVEAPPEEAPPADDALKEAPEAGAELEQAPELEDQIAVAAEALVAVRTRRQIAAAVVWNSMIALAVLLAIAAIALTVAGILGARL